MKYFYLFYIVIFSLSLNAQTTYYVSLDGDNSNDGLTESASWRTIAFAGSSSSPVSEGDIIYVKAGNYGYEDIFIDKNFSKNSKRISFIGYQSTPGDILKLDFEYGDNVDPTKMPLISSGARSEGEGINLNDNYSITIKNFQISKTATALNIWNSEGMKSNHILENIFIKDIGSTYSTAIGVKESSGNIIKNCLIVNATGAGMDIWGDDNLIEHCKVYSNESEAVGDGSYTSMDYYIVLKGDQNVVRNCYIERDGYLEDVGHGMEIKESGEHNLFVDCVAKNIEGGCFSVRWSGVKNNEFRNCKAIADIDEATAFLIRDGASHNDFNSCISENCDYGIQFLLSGEDADYCGEYNTFNNCIIKNSKSVIDLNYWDDNSGRADHTTLANCIIDEADYLFNSERPNSGNILTNCVITQVDNYLQGDHSLNFKFSNCDFYNNGFPMPNGTMNIEYDPLFVSETDYHLQANSPCIDAGSEIDAPRIDFEGTSRPQGNGFDIGAYEFVKSTSVLESNHQQNLVVFPNPTHGQLWISDKIENSSCKIISIFGETISKGHIDNQQIDISLLSDGLWIVEMKDGLKNYSFRIVKN